MRSFSPAFCTELIELMKWRRDVRHFKPGAVDAGLLRDCLAAFSLSPSVGLSEPWRLVRVNSPGNRLKMLDNFKSSNRDALAGYSGDKATIYAGLKLSGMQEAPVQLAIFCDEETLKGAGLGAKTMPEMRRYSVVTAIMAFWLRARAEGLGVGWVSILDPVRLQRDLAVPESWRLVAYLCIGWPEKDDADKPELEKIGWEVRSPQAPEMIER
ncbi:MAG: 5,6-dimethylbenzimidazole synthase [Alphaproteobacteria bacterium]|nr:5,6-dimethylbenzimidazole synthase [Alphaproteobacteria bacterium]